MRRVILTMAAATTLALSAAPAFAGYGALARDNATGKFGLSWNEETSRRAEEVAMKDCGGGSCKVVFRTGPHQCAAMATAQEGNVWGAAYRGQKEAAEGAALRDCQKHTSGQCKVQASGCNR